MTTNILARFLALSMLLVSACDSNDPADGDNGNGDGENRASVTASGALDAEFDGRATFVTVFNISHAITIVLDDNEGTIVLSAFGAADEGTYDINEESEQGVFGASVMLNDLSGPNNPSGVIAITDGSIRITDRRDTRIEGNFTVNGQTVPGGAAITVTGNFDAGCSEGLGICTIGG